MVRVDEDSQRLAVIFVADVSVVGPEELITGNACLLYTSDAADEATIV